MKVVSVPSETDSLQEFNALQAVIRALQPLDNDGRRRIVDAVRTFLRINGPSRPVSVVGSPDSGEGRASRPSYPAFSEDRSMSPKEFMFLKQPRTDVERIAVLAYYLTHFHDVQHFKTL